MFDDLIIAIVLENLYWTKYNPAKLSRSDTLLFTDIKSALTRILYRGS